MSHKQRFSDGELEGLLKKLTAYAILLFAQTGLVGDGVLLKGSGLSPEDLAISTLNKLVCGELKYHRSKGSLYSFSATVMRNDFIDLLRSKAHTTSVTLEEDDPPGEAAEFHNRPREHSQELSKHPDPYSAAAERESEEKVFALVKGDDALEEMAFAILKLEATTPRDIADLLKTNAADIQNRKKRMRRRLAEFFNRHME